MVGEIAKDILGFSNANGGIILFGVDDNGQLHGFAPLPAERVRVLVGPFIGTRIVYEVGHAEVSLQGELVTLPFILVHRTAAAYPGLLRRDVELRKGLLQKVKYLKGSLPYREGAETKVEPAGGDVADIARRLGFRLVAPRTRSSFLVVEDRPGTRLYGHINDRFIGRDKELRTLLVQFDDPRGRGVSIGGLGGIGKTELAIAVVGELHRQRRFPKIYSGTAKRTLLTPMGTEFTDPEFHDYPSFLQDLCGWLGIETAALGAQALETACIEGLKKDGQRVLLFVDNLETVEDARLFEFLDTKLPPNVWLVATSRVHKIRNYIFRYDLTAMDPRDAARLLRHELKRQGLDDLASLDINTLEERAGQLFFHPLAIRWFAWLCGKDRTNWDRGPVRLPTEELEAFCVAHTLRNLSQDAIDVLASIAASQDQIDVDTPCIVAVSAKRPDLVDMALYELESAGLITVAVDPDSGRSTYGVVQLAIGPIRDLMRKEAMEARLASRLRAHIQRPPLAKAEPLVRYLIDINPASVRLMEPPDIRELLERIERARKAAGAFDLELLHLQAECERRLERPITADELYGRAAERVLQNPELIRNERFQQLLLEAATVAIGGGSQAQMRRAVRYLEALPDHWISPLRVPGLLAIAYAHLGDVENCRQYCEILRERLDEDGGYTEHQREQAEAALSRVDRTLKSKGLTT